jgi:glycosyltransferase involved in cell wall biosynthesis
LKALKRYEQIVVETEHLKSRLERNGFASTPIWVIPNVPNIDAVREPNQESHVSLPRREDGEIRLFYPARGYPHKNHRIIGALAEEYLQRTGQTLKVIVTLRDDEVRALNLGPELTRSLINVGEISLRQCAYVYRNADGVLFPSLNETSSATPLEARSLGLPLIASDRSFVTQAVGEYGVLFDPLSPVSGAQAVAQVFSKDICKKLSSGVYTYKEIWTERMRAEALLKVLKVATGLG